MERYVERRFFVVGAELAHVDRFEIVARDRLAAFLDGFADRVRDVIGQIRMHEHGPAAEIDGRNVVSHAFET